jgi:hypothetical protein
MQMLTLFLVSAEADNVVYDGNSSSMLVWSERLLLPCYSLTLAMFQHVSADGRFGSVADWGDETQWGDCSERFFGGGKMAPVTD